MAVSERLIVATPTTSAGGRVISSPFQFYTTGEERLRVVSVNSLTGVRVKIHFRFLDAFGKVQASGYDHVPNSDRTVHTTEHELGVGSLLNLTVFASTGTPLLGQTFVIVQLIRGVGTAAIILGTLLQGYVTSTQHLGWPGSPISLSTEGQGAIRFLTGTTPAPGAELAESVPTGARWQLLTFYTQFNCSAAAATRTPRLRLFNAPVVTNIGIFSSTYNLAANEVAGLTWASGLGAQVFDPITPPGFPALVLPSDTPLTAGMQINTVTQQLQAADQYLAISYMVREWLEVN